MVSIFDNVRRPSISFCWSSFELGFFSQKNTWWASCFLFFCSIVGIADAAALAPKAAAVATNVLLVCFFIGSMLSGEEFITFPDEMKVILVNLTIS